LRKKKPKSESPAAKPKGVDTAKMADKEWQAIVEDWREVSARKRDQVSESSRVRSYDEGETGRKESWQAVCCAA
jgi:hypothetical protein